MCVCVCAQSCSALFDPIDYSPPGSSDHGIFQARILEWVVLPFPPPRHLPDPPLLVSCIGRRVFTTSTALTAGGHTVENPDGTQEPRTPVQSHLPLSAGLLWTSFLTHVCGMCVLSHVRLFAAPWTVACQAPLSREFSRQQYWSGLPFPSPGDLSHPGIEAVSLALAGGFFTD